MQNSPNLSNISRSSAVTLTSLSSSSSCTSPLILTSWPRDLAVNWSRDLLVNCSRGWGDVPSLLRWLSRLRTSTIGVVISPEQVMLSHRRESGVWHWFKTTFIILSLKPTFNVKSGCFMKNTHDSLTISVGTLIPTQSLLKTFKIVMKIVINIFIKIKTIRFSNGKFSAFQIVNESKLNFK